MQRFIRFQTNLRCRQDGCRLGIFCAEREYQSSLELPDFIRDQLDEFYNWFAENLPAPDLSHEHWRALFWFRTDAKKLLGIAWSIVALLNEAGVYVDVLTSADPGHIVYLDCHQVAAIPMRKRGNKRRALRL
jgi:hypothetical protein